MTPDETAELLRLLAATYERDITEGLLAGYTLALADADADEVRRAAVEWLKSDEAFMPRPGQLLSKTRSDPTDTSAEEAWGEVRRAISEVGYMGTPKWSSSRVEAAVAAALGDWRGFCQSAMQPDMVAHRARFIEAFRSIEERREAVEVRESAERVLSGTAQIPGMEGIGRLE